MFVLNFKTITILWEACSVLEGGERLLLEAERYFYQSTLGKPEANCWIAWVVITFIHFRGVGRWRTIGPREHRAGGAGDARSRSNVVHDTASCSVHLGAPWGLSRLAHAGMHTSALRISPGSRALLPLEAVMLFSKHFLATAFFLCSCTHASPPALVSTSRLLRPASCAAFLPYRLFGSKLYRQVYSKALITGRKVLVWNAYPPDVL